MERRLIALAVILGVGLGAGLPAFLGAYFERPMKVGPAREISVEEGPKAVMAPAPEEGQFTMAGAMGEKAPAVERYFTAFLLPILISLFAFLAFNMLIKKG